MIELIMIAMASTLVALLLVWIGRKLTKFRGVNSASLGVKRAAKPRRYSREVASLERGSIGDSKRRELRRAPANAKPWGW